MNIERIAQELVAAKNRAEEAEREYTRKRDEMYNALLAQPDRRFEYESYRFTRSEGGSVITVTKQTVIDALQAENLPPEVLQRIIGAALVESTRWGGLRVLHIGA